MKYDVIVVGTGVAGLNCALNLSKNNSVLLLTKDSKEKNNSNLAQGGISVLKDDNDFEGFKEDTLRAGHYKNNIQAVETLIKESRSAISSLIDIGVRFKTENNNLSYTREGAHRTNRIVYHKDITGNEVTSTLLKNVEKNSNITILEWTKVENLITKDNTCYGVVVSRNNEFEKIYSKYVVLATGGIGGLFKNSTNETHITGDSLSIAISNSIKLKDINYIQIHPTSLYTKENNKRRFLISESLRGEGAILLNSRGERFVDELLPRDIVSKRIFEEMKSSGEDFVYLKASFLGENFLRNRFPNIVRTCEENGYDLINDCIKVTPSQHYFMGGIEVDLNGRTSMSNLFACGETACTGVHGANRLASNSLLEALVFSKRIANFINSSIYSKDIVPIETNLSTALNKELIINLIKREGNFKDDKWFKYK